MAVGSLRRESFNRVLANAIVKLALPEFSFKQLRIDDLPLYNQRARPRRRRKAVSQMSA